MILALALLAAAAPTTRLLLVDETIAVPPRGWREVTVAMRQRPAVIEARYEVRRGGSGVRAMLVKRSDLERLRAGLPHWPIAATAYQRSGAFRAAPGVPGDYSVVLDNSMEGRGAAQVRLTVSLLFPGATPEAREVSPQRRFVIILLSLVFLAGVTTFVAWRLHRALMRGDNSGQAA